VSGGKAERHGLTKCLDSLRDGDTLVVAKLDRLGRSLGNLVQLFQRLAEQGIGVRVLDNPTLGTDGNSAQAKLMLGIFGALAEYERDLIRERTNVGLVAARARGRNGGRPKLVDSRKISRAKHLHAAGVMRPQEIANPVGVSVPTLYRVGQIASGGGNNETEADRERRGVALRAETWRSERLGGELQGDTGAGPSGCVLFHASHVCGGMTALSTAQRYQAAHVRHGVSAVGVTAGVGVVTLQKSAVENHLTPASRAERS
jgi:DNA invertase Pin-like site-specific DNA recombinase